MSDPLSPLYTQDEKVVRQLKQDYEFYISKICSCLGITTSDMVPPQKPNAVHTEYIYLPNPLSMRQCTRLIRFLKKGRAPQSSIAASFFFTYSPATFTVNPSLSVH